MTRSAKRPINRVAAKDKFHNFKVCTECGENKRLADFALANDWRKKRAANPQRYRPVCKQCTRAPAATEVDPAFKPDRKNRRRKQTPAAARAVKAKYKRKLRRETRIKALEYLAGKGCCHCGERDPRVLEFDHIEPRDKNAGIARLLANGQSWGSEVLRAEIRKCRVICSNCHRLHTAEQMEYYGHDDVQAALRKIYATYDITE